MRGIGATVESALDQTLTRLTEGEIGLHELTPALAGWYCRGYDDGRDSVRPELDQAEADAARLYELHYNPKRKLTPTLNRWVEAAIEHVETDPAIQRTLAKLERARQQPTRDAEADNRPIDVQACLNAWSNYAATKEAA